MFKCCIEGPQDKNKNGIPDLRVRIEAFGFPLLDTTIDADPQPLFSVLGRLVGDKRIEGIGKFFAR